jgi:peroxiredoxin
MARVELGVPAPDFELRDFRGIPVRLSDYEGTHRVLLVFNRGFT